MPILNEIVPGPVSRRSAQAPYAFARLVRAGVLLVLVVIVRSTASASPLPLELVIQSGHLAEVTDVAYSPDGCLVATAGADNHAKVWDEATGKELRSFRAGESAHTGLSFLHGGDSLVITTANGAVTRWRIQDGKLETRYASESNASERSKVSGVVVDTSGQRVLAAAAGEKGQLEIRIWHAQSGKPLKTLSWQAGTQIKASHLEEADRELAHEPVRVAVGAGGDLVASAGTEGRTALWSVDREAPVRFYGADSRSESETDVAHLAVAFSPDGTLLAGSHGTLVYVWRVDSSAVALELSGNQRAITALAFSEDGDLIATGGAGGEVKIWDAKTGRTLTKFDAHAGTVHSVAFRPRGSKVVCEAQVATTDNLLSEQVLVTGGADNAARIWSLPTGHLIRSLNSRVQPLNDVEFSADGTLLAVASSASPHGSAKIWNLTSGYEVSELHGHEGGVNAVSFSPDGALIATAGVDRSTILWNASTLAPVAEIGGRKRSRLAKVIAGLGAIWMLSNDSARELIGNSAIESALSTTAHQRTQGALALAFDAQNKYLAIGNNGKTALWDRAKGELLEPLDNRGVRDLTFMPDGKGVLSAAGFANLRDLATGEKLAKYARSIFGKNTGVTSVDVDNLGQRVALGYRSGEIVLKRPLSEKVKEKLHEFQSDPSVHVIRFSPDGGVLIAGHSSGAVRAFDVSHGIELTHELVGHTNTVLAADFSPDGKLLATASADGTARIWRTGSWEEVVVFVSIGSEDYIVLSPDNYYAASTNGHYGVAFRRGNTLFPFEQFDLQLNRPDLVFSRLGTVAPELIEGYRRAFEKRLRRMNLTEEMLGEETELPRVEIRDLPRRLTTTEGTLSFTVVAEDGRTPIERINVWVNDVPLYGSEGRAVAGQTKTVSVPVSIELSEGRNRIQVSALNRRGLESIRATIETIFDRPEGQKPDLYLVAVGVSDYDDDRLDLAYAAKDAGDLVEALSAQERFGQVHVLSFLDGNATRERIFAVKEQLKRSRVDDEVILFVAGHGLVTPDLDYYFATADIDFENPSDRGISDEQLEDLLDDIPARKKLLLMDTCYSGEIDRDLDDMDAIAKIVAPNVVVRPVRALYSAESAPPLSSSDSFHLMQTLFANLGRGSGAVVVSAAGGNEFAFEGSGTLNGVFTYSLIEAFGSVEDDAHLRLSQLREFVVKRVRQLTAGQQTPSIRRVNLEFDYPIFSVKEPKISDLPEIDTPLLGKLFLSAIEHGVTEPDK